MIDINTLISNALIAAVQQATAHLVERIANLEALTDRVVALENQAIVTSNAVDARISALENNPAQGQDLTPTTGLTRDQVEALIERTMDLHLECYDHDSYDEVYNEWGGESADAYVKASEVEDAVREVVEGLSFEVSVS